MTDSRPLVSSGTRGIFRTLMTDSTVGAITTAFEDEGFTKNQHSTYEDSSVRRALAQSYLEAIDWTNPQQVDRAIRVFERLVYDFEEGSTDQFKRALSRDGYSVDANGAITPIGPRLLEGALSGLRDPAAIREQLDRIQRAIGDDPALAVGSAKELIESTAKVVLIERGQVVNDRDDLPELVKAAQQALKLHPSQATAGPDGSDAVKKILGSVSGLAIGVAELRNRGYGTGHGASGVRVGLKGRHAHLAVNAAFTWCQLMLDTLADPGAPWRKDGRPRSAEDGADPCLAARGGTQGV